MAAHSEAVAQNDGSMTSGTLSAGDPAELLELPFSPPPEPLSAIIADLRETIRDLKSQDAARDAQLLVLQEAFHSQRTTTSAQQGYIEALHALLRNTQDQTKSNSAHLDNVSAEAKQLSEKLELTEATAKDLKQETMSLENTTTSLMDETEALQLHCEAAKTAQTGKNTRLDTQINGLEARVTALRADLTTTDQSQAATAAELKKSTERNLQTSTSLRRDVLDSQESISDFRMKFIIAGSAERSSKRKLEKLEERQNSTNQEVEDLVKRHKSFAEQQGTKDGTLQRQIDGASSVADSGAVNFGMLKEKVDASEKELKILQQQLRLGKGLYR